MKAGLRIEIDSIFSASGIMRFLRTRASAVFQFETLTQSEPSRNSPLHGDVRIDVSNDTPPLAGIESGRKDR